MEKRIGSVLIIVPSGSSVAELNSILSAHYDIIIGRMGIKAGVNSANLISLVIKGTTDRIGSLTGKIGKIKGLEVKSVLSKYIEKGETDHEIVEQ